MSSFSYCFRQLHGSTVNGIGAAEQDSPNGTVIVSEGLVESPNPTKTDMSFKNDISNKNVGNQNKVKPTEKNELCSVLRNFFKIRFHAFMKSKAPTYMCLSIYIIICLLGNIVTGIILVKHYLSSHEQRESINNLTQDIFTQIELRENETSVDSGLAFNIDEVEIDELDQQLNFSEFNLMNNESNEIIEVSSFFNFSVSIVS